MVSGQAPGSASSSLSSVSLSTEGGRQPKRGSTNKEKDKRNQEATLKSGQKIELLQLNYLCRAPGWWSRKLMYCPPACHNQVLKKMQNTS